MTTIPASLARAARPTNPARPLDIPPPAPAHAFRWRKVSRLFRTIRHADDQVQAGLMVLEAVGGMDRERTFQRFARNPAGQQMLWTKPDLVSLLSNRVGLASLPEGSLGRAYLAFCESNGFAADGLVEKSRSFEHESASDDPYRRWFWDRVTLTHDLWHVLTDCPTTPEGESRLLWFSYAQNPSRGLRVILVLTTYLTGLDLGRHRAHWRSWRAGKRARDLSVVSWEEWLARPLDEMRAHYGVVELMAC